jgi:hypothetical protein
MIRDYQVRDYKVQEKAMFQMLIDQFTPTPGEPALI